MADLLGDDPAAEFLQQEEDQLRELGIDDGQFDSEPVNLSKNDMGSLMDDFGGDMNPPENEEPPMVNGFMNEPAPMNPIEMAVEPESIIKWREEREAALKKQDEDEIEAQASWGEKAKKELEDWYHHYNEQLDKVKKENRLAQEQFIEEMTDTQPGNPWEKVARYCDFNPKYSKNTKDVSRMRGLLLQLKQSPLTR